MIWGLFFLLAVCDAATQIYNFHVNRDSRSPDCAPARSVITINGVFPGPPIIVNKGDTVIVTIYNDLPSEAITVHWHGILQSGTPWADGPAYITQCPIFPDNEYTYNMTVNQAGTFWYHSHIEASRTEGLYGAFIVKDPSEGLQYDDDLYLLLTEWYHKNNIESVTGLLLKGRFIFPGNGESVLINGKGQSLGAGNAPFAFDCRSTNCAACPSTVVNVTANKRYRIRIINAAALSYFKVNFENHTVELVETDGSLTQPMNITNLELSSGERYSVILTADQPANNYQITVETKYRGSPFPPANPRGTAVLHYSTANASVFTQPKNVTWQTWDINAVQAKSSIANCTKLPKATKSFTFSIKQTYEPVPQAAGGSLKWPLSGIPYDMPSTPTLWASFLNMTNIYDNTNSSMKTVALGDVVDIIIQNGVAGNGKCEQHPFHLHGHAFWVVEHGAGKYDPNAPENPICHPIVKDTAVVYPSAFNDGGGNATAPCGWLKIRWVADNAGTWLFHCHVDWHMEMGMGTVFEVGHGSIPPPPKNTPVCGVVPFVQGTGTGAVCNTSAALTGTTYSLAFLFLGLILACMF